MWNACKDVQKSGNAEEAEKTHLIRIEEFSKIVFRCILKGMGYTCASIERRMCSHFFLNVCFGCTSNLLLFLRYAYCDTIGRS